MKLTRVHIIKAATCGGLLDGLDVTVRALPGGAERFDPLCLVGSNGTGKSQFLQVIAEAFQVVFYACAREEERMRGNEELEFEIEYVIRPAPDRENVLVRLSRRSEGKRRPIRIERKDGLDWVECSLAERESRALLPSRIIGYTSGDNETLSLPFLISRSGYAEDVRTRALSLDPAERAGSIPNTRLMLIDYATHLEVLVANLILGTDAERVELLIDAKLGEIHSFRCIVQLADGPVAKLSYVDASGRKQRGVQLTDELKGSIENLRRCSTCYDHDEMKRTYVFDFLVTDQTREAFRCFWQNAIELYSALHKLSMLNDLAIPRRSRDRLQHDIKTRRFASRLPEPQDEDRVFRFEQVRFAPKVGSRDVDYVSLSDGEHQLAQIFGTMCMIADTNVLFLLDEPESHFNPQWRVRFISRLMNLPTAQGPRCNDDSPPAQQDCLLTTHAPFVPSDMSWENILIFRRDESKADQGARVKVQRPGIQTFGTAFDTILQECFDVQPPISARSREQIKQLMESEDPEEIKAGLAGLGDSVERVFLMDRRRQLLKQQG